MAKVKGGITGRPAGKVAELIFGAARTREGKVVTVREAVNPSNPQTADQQAQRGKFQQALDIAKAIGPSIYQEDWNRSVGQLPGFQAWMSLLLNNIDGSDVLQPPSDVQLGDLHFPNTTGTSSTGSSSEIGMTWSTENGPNGTGADKAVLVAIEQDEPTGRKRDVVISTANDRGDSSEVLEVGQASTDYVVALYFRGAGSAEGLLSLAEFITATSSA